jgi:hypothetical protein
MMNLFGEYRMRMVKTIFIYQFPHPLLIQQLLLANNEWESIVVTGILSGSRKWK